MASVKKFPGCRYWYACYTLPNGKRVQRSTHLTSRTKALAKAEQLEEVWRNQLSARQTHRLITEVYAAATGENLHSSNAEEYFAGWLKRKRLEVTKATNSFYSAATKTFLAFLGPKAAKPMQFVTPTDIVDFRDKEAERVSASTVNHRIKFLRSVFKDAKRDGRIADNPAEDVKTLRKSQSRKRRPFTTDELRAVLSVANEEWRSLVIFGVYTGQRLADLALLRWTNIDPEASEVRILSRKTSRTTVIPIASPLADQIATLPVSDDPEGFIHPKAAAIVERQGKTGTLSNQFQRILVSAGLAQKKKHRKKVRGEGDDRPVEEREFSALSFHSLRHTTTSMLKNAGVSDAVAKDIVGHESTAISDVYTHIDSEAKKKALDKLPDLGGS